MSATRCGHKACNAACVKAYAPNVQLSDLSLVDVPKGSENAAEATDASSAALPDTHAAQAGDEPAAAPGDASRNGDAPGVTWGAPLSGTVSERVSRAASEDRFRAKARKEYAAGNVDPVLWTRALAQTGGDELLARRIYLDSRATALRVAKRNENTARRALVVEVLSSAPDPGFAAEKSKASDETSSEEARPGRAAARPNRKRMVLAAGVLGFIIVGAGLMALWPESGPTQPTELGKSPGVRPARVSQSTPPATSADAPARAGGMDQDVSGRVQALEKAGNWNLLVIYAAEWTRKQPGNAIAWKELSRGYSKLRQFGDALDAAMKATQLAPEDFLVWQNLGQLNVALERSVEALSAFERATALNDKDVISLVQLGILNTQVGRLSDARIAFDKALTVSPDDVGALCGAGSLAHKEGRAKDAEAMLRQAAALGGACRDPGAVASVRVAADDVAQSKSKSAPARRPQ